MGGYISILFVDTNDLPGEIVKAVTGCEWSHVGIMAFNGIVEAVPPRVAVSPPDTYDSYRTRQVDFYVPDKDAALAELTKLIGRPYGWLDCVAGGVYDLAGVQIPLTGARTTDCSELAVRVLRAGGAKVAKALDADCFTPKDLYQATVNEFIARKGMKPCRKAV